MGRLRPDEKPNAQLVQHPVGQGEVVGGICRRGLDGKDSPVNVLQLLQVF